MIASDATGPSLGELRPERESAPIIVGLEELLLNAPADGPDACIAYALATLSTYAYSDLETLAGMATRLGLPNNRCRKLEVEVDALFVRSTAYLIQSADGRVVLLVYRGTSPTSAVNWLGDIDIDPQKIEIDLDGDGVGDDVTVHRGFYRNVRATGWEVVRGLRRAAAGQAVTGDESAELGPMEALYIAGHSLGGAMASLSAILLHTINAPEIAGRIRGVYTYGAPMVGDPRLAELCDAPELLGGKVFRYVYGNDVVPQLPPKASGKFRHFGREFRCKLGEGDWEESRKAVGQLHSLLQLAELVPSFLARQVSVLRDLPFQASLADHLPAHYLDALAAPIGVRTEFGG